LSEATLYERLGGAKGIAAITEDIWGNHTSNPLVQNRYAKSDPENVKMMVRDFFGAGTGGSENYKGQDMLTAHTGMNINDQEFNGVVDDVLKALRSNGIGDKEHDEVLAILYSMKGDIVGV